VISLPMHPYLPSDDVARIARALTEITES